MESSNATGASSSVAAALAYGKESRITHMHDFIWFALVSRDLIALRSSASCDVQVELLVYTYIQAAHRLKGNQQVSQLATCTRRARLCA